MEVPKNERQHRVTSLREEGGEDQQWNNVDGEIDGKGE
jgi:hypothetical protein